MVRWGIDTPIRKAHFLGQIVVESGKLATVSESLNYSVQGLLATFSRARISQQDAQRLGRDKAKGQPADQEAIANILYGGEWGRANLGNQKPGDGWRYRGRGLKQLTGLANYQAYQTDSGRPVVQAPDLLLTPEAAADSAGWFWWKKDLNGLADQGEIGAITKRVNGGQLGLLERTRATQQALKALA